MAKSRGFQVGDRVAYSVKLLRSTFQHTGDAPRLRGTIRAMQDFGGGSCPKLCTVEWDNCFVKSEYHDDGMARIIEPNLTLVSRIAIDAALNT